MSPQEIFTLFGRTVVLLRVNGKAPIDPAWDDMTVGHMTEAYLAGLNGNIGILHGAASGNLNGIEFDSVEAAKSWFRANRHWAENCLWSKGKRGPCFWVFIKGDYPKNHNLYDENGDQVGEWRADGRQTVFSGVHPDGMVYTHKGTPATITYDQIVWPDDVRVAKPAAPAAVFDDSDIIAKVGPPFWRDQQGFLAKMNWQYFIERFCAENLVLFEQDEGSFFIYGETTGAWFKVVPEVIKEMIRADYQHLTRAFAEPNMEKRVSNNVYNSIVNGVQSLSGRTDVFKPLKNIVHCANTMLHLEGDDTVKEAAFSPDYYSRNPCPIAWNPEARAPQIEAILAVQDPADADLILRYAANALLGGNPSQQILLLSGQAGTSKSTICDLIEMAVGRRNVAELRTEHLDKQFEIGRYIGKSMLSGKDVPGDFLQSRGAARIKALTGHDMLTGEIKHEGGTPEIFGDFAIIITCNTRLIVRLEGDTDLSAWTRRILLITFTEKHVHEKVINDYADKLFAEEGEGLLVLLVQAAFRHLRELREIGRFTVSPAQKERVEALLAESRSIELFVRDRVYKDPQSDISSDEMTTAYNEFCEDRGWAPVKLGILQRELPGLMARYHQSNLGSHCMRPDKQGIERRARGYPKVSLLDADDYENTDGSEAFNENEL